MNTPSTNRYKHHRFPAEIISHGVWLYFRFCLSYRDVEELLFARGVIVTYEAIRKWCRKFGQAYANQLRRRRPRPGDKWHLDEVFLTINGARQYLWRAVDQDGNVLDILVQPRRDKKAAKRFFRKLLKGCQYVPRVLITDKLASYGAAKRELLPVWSITSTATATTARRTRTSRPASGNGACRGVNHRVMRSDSSPRMVPLPSTSARDGIGCRPPTIVEKCGTDSTASRTSQPSLPQHKNQNGRPSCPFLPGNHVNPQ
jgi:transposase-like protein